MIKMLLVGLPIMALSLLVQVATAYWSMRNYAQHATQSGPRGGFFAGSVPLLVAMLIMMMGNIVQIVIWAGVFMIVGEFDQLIEAIYHSTVNFASLGYGDIVMSARWRLLGALEALNGVIMLGMTGAALMAILQNIIRQQRAEGYRD